MLRECLFLLEWSTFFILIIDPSEMGLLRYVRFLSKWVLMLILTYILFNAYGIILILMTLCNFIVWLVTKREPAFVLRIREFAFDNMMKISEEISELWHFFDARPRIGGKTNGWELVAAMRSSKGGFRDRQFSPVINTCDFNWLDDPFWPEYTADVYMLEIRSRLVPDVDRNSVTIWQVSLLDGGQKKMHHFEHDRNWGDFDALWLHLDDVLCFQNAGIVLVSSEAWLYIHDLRIGKSGTYKLWKNRFPFGTVVSAFCLGRIRDSDGSVIGWRVRVLKAKHRLFLHVDDQNHWNWKYRAHLVNAVFDLKETVTLVTKEKIIFGWFPCELFSIPTLTPVRTKTAFGVYAVGHGQQDGPVVIFDEAKKDYAYYAYYAQFQNSDTALYRYMVNQPPISDRDQCQFPVVLSDNECIACSKDGRIYRLESRLAPMKYTAAKALLRLCPELRYEITANQFRDMTGLRGMNAHFDK